MARSSVARFFVLVFALSIPFATIGFVVDLQLAPGIPISALGFICPVTAAVVLEYRENGSTAVKGLLKRAVDYQRIDAGWFVPIVLIMPVVSVVTFGVMRLMGEPLLQPHVSPVPAIVMLLVFFLAALGEELGWSGYEIDRLQARWSTLNAAILLGLVWAVWHIVAMVQAGQSWAWIAWGCLDMVATRVIMVWLYNGAGKSVFAVALYHAIANSSMKTVFPGGSYHAERISSVILAAIAAAVALFGTQLGTRALSQHGSDDVFSSDPRVRSVRRSTYTSHG